jgi:antitoxin component YwqK of YwqJK toxin-antitoxin module
MKLIKTLLYLLFITLLSSPSWSEGLSMDDLVERNGLYYKKFTDVPFTGEISGLETGSFKKGEKNGKWIHFYKNGQLFVKGNYKDGKREDGLWEFFYENGQLLWKGNYQDGKDDGLWEFYHKNGQLQGKGNYKDGKPDGLWEYFNEDGSLKRTKTWKDGTLKKIEVFKNGELVE